MRVCSSVCSVPLLLPSHAMRRGDPYECLKAVQSQQLSETSDPQSIGHLRRRDGCREGGEGKGGRIRGREGERGDKRDRGRGKVRREGKRKERRVREMIQEKRRD